METCRIKLDLTATWCNNWPLFMVIGNNNIYFDGEAQGDITVEFEMPLQEHNQLTLKHHGKYFGEGNRWDTRSSGDQIIQDRAIRINAVWLDDVDIKCYLYSHWPMHTQHGQIQTDYMGHNGHITIDFGARVYDWIITQLVAPREQNKPVFDLVVETSFGNLFDYSQDLAEIQEIESILNQHAHIIDQSTQIRNP